MSQGNNSSSNKFLKLYGMDAIEKFKSPVDNVAGKFRCGDSLRDSVCQVVFFLFKFRI